MRSPYAPQTEAAEARRRSLSADPAEIVDEIVRDGPLTVEEMDTASRRFKRALIERALGGELTHHLGYPPGAARPERGTNHRNGTSGKTVLTDEGPVAIDVRAIATGRSSRS